MLGYASRTVSRRTLLTAAIPIAVLLFTGGALWTPRSDTGATTFTETTAVRSAHGMVVSATEPASRVGAEVLEAGGNAVDAAIATGFALAVTHPAAGNIGGGGFMVIRFPDGEVTAFDYREKAPLAATPRARAH